MSKDPFDIKVQEKSYTRRKSKPNKTVPVLLIFLAVIISLVFKFTIWRGSQAPSQSSSAKAEIETPQSTDNVSNRDTEQRDNVYEDDGQTLWVSPTKGNPIDLSYLPAGTQAIVNIRPADLLAHSEGDKLLAALGPWGKDTVATIKDWTGVTLKEIETLCVALYPSQSGSIEIGLRLELIESWENSQLAQSLNDSSQDIIQGQKYFEQSGRVCFLPEAEMGRILVSCQQDILVEILQQGAEPVLFPRDFERVLNKTDANRMATLVISNKFMQFSGHKFLKDSAKELQSTFVDLIRDDAATIALSAHWDDNFFVEIVSTVNLNRRPHRYAAAIENRLGQYPNALESLFDSKQVHAYGKKIVERFPEMLRMLSRYSRAAEVDRMTVVRSYLPQAAGHNLLLAAELVIQDFSDINQSVMAEATNQETLTERLQQTTSLAFPKETLQKALEMLSEDIGVPIKIAGGDLQLEGITKNQSLGLELRDKPAEEILLEVLLRANPDRTASGPKDTKQKLVYFLDKAAGVVIVTTRSAAKKRRDSLPAVFVPSN